MERVNGIYLGIDSATRYLALALWHDERGLLAEYAEDLGRDHASRIVPELQRLFERARLEPGAVDGIGVGVGPGSYTGVRVGMATARGLGRAWGVPVAGASTLAGIALRGLAPGERGVAVVDARRGNVYAARFLRPRDPTEYRLTPLDEPRKLPREALAERAVEGDARLRVVEGVPPDAAHTAAVAGDEAPLEALYL